MTIDIQNDPIYNGKICPYCNNPAEYVDSSVVYKTSYGMIYFCRPYDAYVGVHHGTDIALGRLANYELRVAKIKAHDAFDKIFRTGLINKIWPEKLPDTTNRKKAYKWLAKQMNNQHRNQL